MEKQKELRTHYREQHERFVYYIVALSVTSIGFAVYKTTGLPLRYSQIPLGIAVLSWGLSIYCGFRGITQVMHVTFVNNAFFDVIQGQHPLSGTHPEKIQIGVNTLTRIMNEGSENASKYFHRQTTLFYVGVIAFLTWHVYEMYLSSLPPGR